MNMKYYRLNNILIVLTTISVMLSCSQNKNTFFSDQLLCDINFRISVLRDPIGLEKEFAYYGGLDAKNNTNIFLYNKVRNGESFVVDSIVVSKAQLVSIIELIFHQMEIDRNKLDYIETPPRLFPKNEWRHSEICYSLDWEGVRYIVVQNDCEVYKEICQIINIGRCE